MDRETTAHAVRARQSDRAAVGSNELTRDRQTEAQTLWEAALLDAAVERFEYALALLHGNARAGVGHIDADIALVRAGAERDTPARRRVLDRVAKQVADRLSQTIGIDVDHWQI